MHEGIIKSTLCLHKIRSYNSFSAMKVVLGLLVDIVNSASLCTFKSYVTQLRMTFQSSMRTLGDVCTWN